MSADDIEEHDGHETPSTEASGEEVRAETGASSGDIAQGGGDGEIIEAKAADALSNLPRNTADAVAYLRRKLLDIGKRNRLISTPLRNSRAKQLKVIDELSDEVFRLLAVDGKKMSFLPVPDGQEDGEAEETGNAGENIYLPPDEEEVDESGLAKRHTDLFLQTGYKPEPLQKRLLGLSRDAKTLEEEQGISVLFLALGFLKWFESDASEVERFAPLILLPVNLVRDDIRGRFKLELREEDMQVNLSLQAMLEADFALRLPELPEEEEWLPSDYFAAVEAVISEKRRWAVERDEIVLGFYSFAKFLMWRDLDPANWPEGNGIAGNPLLDKLLVDGFETEERVISEDRNLDEVYPDPSELKHIMDADASQTQVIAAARAGRNLVVQGPPGTGKSQTIANIIATAVADGKRVLFVAEKMTALTVVHDRLVERGLGDICLELHSNKANKKAVLQQLSNTLQAGRPLPSDPRTYVEVRQLRDKLNGLSKLIHRRDETSERTPFEVIGQIVRLREAGAALPDFELPDTEKWDREKVNAAVRDLAAFAEETAKHGRETEHAWRGVTRRLSPMDRERLAEMLDKAQAALDKLLAASQEASEICAWDGELNAAACDALLPQLDALRRMPSEITRLVGNQAALADLDRVSEVCRTIETLRDENTALEAAVVDAALEMEWGELRGVIASKGQSLFRMLDGAYRESVAKLKSVCKGLPPKAFAERLELLDALIHRAKTARKLERDAEFAKVVFDTAWRDVDTDTSEVLAASEWLSEYAGLFDGPENLVAVAEPLVGKDIDLTLQALEQARTGWTDQWSNVLQFLGLDTQIAFGESEASAVPFLEIRTRIANWKSDPEGIVTWFHISQAAERCRELGLSELCERVNDGRILPENVVAQFQYAWAEALWRRMVSENVELNDIDGTRRHEQVQQFRKLDATLKELAAQEIALAHYERIPRGGAGQMGLVRAEIAKRRRHMPVRKLMDHAGSVISQLKPVFMMSPLSVSQFLRPGNLRFDLLVIDEASQVKPEDALGAVIRSDQIIVVGDQKQLPPTSFFDRSMEDGDEAEEDEDDIDAEDAIGRVAVRQVASMESILSLCHARDMHGDVLRWHYRSQHPSLIEVSNHEFYDDRLIYPPSPDQNAPDAGLSFHRVNGIYERGRSRQNPLEAKSVADAVMEHARNRPHLSLGVATFSTAQRDAILNRIEFLRTEHPELESFFGEGRRERFFVKSLENVQGDERDVIMVSVGYGRDDKGYMSQSFGPVSSDGGERRLNVLFTRAKKNCRVFSSITYRDISLDGAVPAGRRALARFLKYAELGDLDIPQITGEGTDSPFEDAVAAALTRHGYEVATQVGSAGFRVDLGVCDPSRPGHFVLGIECDGARYHSSRWARERDRLRQSVLEAKGWTIHRIWSTDWFERPEAELQKVLAAIEKQMAGGKRDDRFPVTSSSPAVIEREVFSDDAHSLGAEYQEANFTPSGAGRYELHDAPTGLISESVLKIISEEGPIHSEEVARRLSTLWGYQRAGSRIQTTVAKSIKSLHRQEKIVGDQFERPFVFDAPNRNSPFPACRDRSGVRSSTLRKPTFIPIAEIIGGLIQVVEQNGALPVDEAAREVGRLLGFKSTSRDLKDRVAAALEAAYDHGVLDEVAGMVNPAPNSLIKEGQE